MRCGKCRPFIISVLRNGWWKGKKEKTWYLGPTYVAEKYPYLQPRAFGGGNKSIADMSNKLRNRSTGQMGKWWPDASTEYQSFGMCNGRLPLCAPCLVKIPVLCSYRVRGAIDICKTASITLRIFCRRKSFLKRPTPWHGQEGNYNRDILALVI